MLCFSTPGARGELPFRRFGTNLYDLGPVLARETNRNAYVIYGKVLRVRGDSIEIMRPVPNRYDLSSSARDPLLYGDSGDMLHYLHAAKLAEQDVTPGHFLSLSPELKRFLIPKIEVIELLHFPYECKPGMTVLVTAFPRALRDRTLPQYDYGEPLEPPITNFSSVFVVYEDRILKRELGPTGAGPKIAPRRP